MYPIFVFTMYD